MMTVFLIALIAASFFVLAMSLTLIFKGRHIDSEIGDNRNMKERGIECAARQFMDEERNLRGECSVQSEGCAGKSCASCGDHDQHHTQKPV